MTATNTDAAGVIGPTLDALPTGQRPQPLPACATCPKAMWYRTPQRLQAFCRELRHVTWQDGEQEPIIQCDGREAALMTANEPAG